MNARRTITFLLILAISIAAIVHQGGARAAVLSAAALEDEPRLKPEDELEARQIVARFSERLREANDVGPIIDELFVKDFSERIRQPQPNSMPWWIVDKKLFARASREELRRYYVASINFYGLTFNLNSAVKQQRKLSGNDEEDGDADFEAAMTPEIISVLLSDPTLARLLQHDNEDENDGRAKEEERSQPAPGGDSTQAQIATKEERADAPTEASEEGIIKELSQLNNVSATLEKANGLMRKRLASLTAVLPVWPEPVGQEEDSSRFDLTTLDEGDYGYAKDTQVIHTEAPPFCLYLIRTGDQLKILSVILYVD